MRKIFVHITSQHFLFEVNGIWWIGIGETYPVIAIFYLFENIVFWA